MAGEGGRSSSHLWEAKSEQAGFCSVSAAGQQNWCSTVSFLRAESGGGQNVRQAEPTLRTPQHLPPNPAAPSAMPRWSHTTLEECAEHILSIQAFLIVRGTIETPTLSTASLVSRSCAAVKRPCRKLLPAILRSWRCLLS